MTREEFIRSEHATKDGFMRRFADADHAMPAGSVGYVRQYHCPCGFSTTDPSVIWDHTASSPRHRKESK